MPMHFTTFPMPAGLQQVSGFRNWPLWAKLGLVIAALPGLVVLALSLLLIVVSILALSLLALPTYVAITRVLGKQSQSIETSSGTSPGAKRVEVTVVDRPV